MRKKDKEWIDKENWEKASGIIVDHQNSALATRDYSIECDSPFCITIVQGYWIWWCSVHHQPLANCEMAKLKEE